MALGGQRHALVALDPGKERTEAIGCGRLGCSEVVRVVLFRTGREYLETVAQSMFRTEEQLRLSCRFLCFALLLSP